MMNNSCSDDDTQLSNGENTVLCCKKSWKIGAHYNKHINRVHNLRLKCECCGDVAAEKRELNRHYWVSHKEYANRNNVPNPEGNCKACGMYFTRKDRIRRHLERFPSCREKLGL